MAERNVWQWLKQDLDKQRSQLSYPMMKRLEVSNRRGWFDVLLCIRQVTVFFELKFVKGTYKT